MTCSDFWNVAVLFPRTLREDNAIELALSEKPAEYKLLLWVITTGQVDQKDCDGHVVATSIE